MDKLVTLTRTVALGLVLALSFTGLAHAEPKAQLPKSNAERMVEATDRAHIVRSVTVKDLGLLTDMEVIRTGDLSLVTVLTFEQAVYSLKRSLNGLTPRDQHYKAWTFITLLPQHSIEVTCILKRGRYQELSVKRNKPYQSDCLLVDERIIPLNNQPVDRY